MKAALLLSLALSLTTSLCIAASQKVISGPAGSDSFGSSVIALSSGNFLVLDPDYDHPSPAITDAGAVYL